MAEVPSSPGNGCGHARRRCDSNVNHNDTATRPRRGLRIFIGTANLGHALPDHDSLSAWIPRHGKIHHVLSSDHIKPSSIVEGVSKEHWNGIDSHGKIEVIAIGMQESVAGSNVFTATGLTAKLTGTSVRERNTFAKALGADLGKPIDDFEKKVNKMLHSGGSKNKDAQAEVGGTKKLKEIVENHVGDDYALITQYQRGEMVFYLFVRNDLTSISTVTEVRAKSCGLGSIMANKGGIATQLTVGSTRISFISVHLAAGETVSNYEQRNKNVEEILQGTDDPTLKAHHAFFFGDLNYRISLPPNSKGTRPSKDETLSFCKRFISQRDWSTLTKHDELEKALLSRDILAGFQTPQLRTFPTFKCERRTGFHYNYQRAPSYADRILWKSIEETPRAIEPIIYEPIPSFSTSDHKPMRGLFFLPSRPSLTLDPEKTMLYIALTGFKCKGLKPAVNIVKPDVNAYLKFLCEPSNLEKPNSPKKRTSTVKISDRPSWRREEIQFEINVSSKEELHGAYLYIKCMNENVLSGDSLLGTVILDLEHIVRKSLGVLEWKNDIERHFLRSGKEVGKLYCGMDICWDKSRRSQHRPKEQPRVVRTAPSHESVSSKERTPPRTKKKVLDKEPPEKSLNDYLTKLDLPQGVLSTVIQNYRSCDKRYWFIENSTSMRTRDSHVMGTNFEWVQASRWEELYECVCYHAKFAAKCRLPTFFRLMNAACESTAETEQFSVCFSKQNDVASQLEKAESIMNDAKFQPKSPLTRCIGDFKREISCDAAKLQSKGKHVTLVMCTQGLSTDQSGDSEHDSLRQIKHSLYSLSKLPVKIVIRLCTSKEETTRFYNTLDSKLDNLDVLDDYWGEAMEVYLHNPWICYGFGVHRLREAGLAWGLVDDLDGRPLDLNEIHQFCNHFFFGKNKKNSGLPHPCHWKSFIHGLSELLKKEKMQWNPVKKKFTPWISLSMLESMHQPAQRKGTRTSRNSKQSQKQNQQHQTPNNVATKPTTETLESIIHHWSHQPPTYEQLNPLHHLLVRMPDVFPPTNMKIESHEHFLKWNPIAKEAFSESGDELEDLLKRAMRKAKLFLHPDKLPKDLTENQAFLFRKMWDVLLESEGATLK